MATFRIENYDASDTVDLLSGDTKLLQGGGWSWVVRPDDEDVTSTFAFLVTGAAESNIRANFRTFIEALQDAFDFLNDPTHYDSYWLRWATDGETAKRTLIKTYEVNVSSDEYQSPLIEQYEAGTGIVVNVAITHSNAYEDVSDTSMSFTSTGSNRVEKSSFTSSLSGGDDVGRIPYLEIDTNANDPVARVWMGFKPDKAGQTLSDLDFSWTAGDGNSFSHDSSDTSLVSNYYQTTFSTDDGLIPRVGLKFEAFYSSTWKNLAGRYRVLLRYASPTSGTGCEVQLGIGGAFNPTLNSLPLDKKTPVTLYSTGGNVNVVELGEVEIPIARIGQHGYDELDFRKNEFVISISRFEGTGEFRTHGIMLVPSEHFVFIESEIALDDTDTGLDIPRFVIESLPDGQNSAYMTTDYGGSNANRIKGLLSPAFEDWGYPREGGLLVFVLARSDSYSSLDNATVSVNVRRRWRGYHG